MVLVDMMIKCERRGKGGGERGGGSHKRRKIVENSKGRIGEAKVHIKAKARSPRTLALRFITTVRITLENICTYIT